MDINELQPIKPTRDSLLQDQQTSQLCCKIAIPEGEKTCSLLYTKCFSLGSLVFYIKANARGGIFCSALKLLFVLSQQRGTSRPPEPPSTSARGAR